MLQFKLDTLNDNREYFNWVNIEIDMTATPTQHNEWTEFCFLVIYSSCANLIKRHIFVFIKTSPPLLIYFAIDADYDSSSHINWMDKYIFDQRN